MHISGNLCKLDVQLEKKRRSLHRCCFKYYEQTRGRPTAPSQNTTGCIYVESIFQESFSQAFWKKAATPEEASLETPPGMRQLLPFVAFCIM